MGVLALASGLRGHNAGHKEALGQLPRCVPAGTTDYDPAAIPCDAPTNGSFGRAGSSECWLGVIGIAKACGYSFIAPVDASTPTPMIPPKSRLPRVHPWKFDGIVANASWKPAFVQRTWISSLVLSTFATPGVITVQFPSLLDRMQEAPDTGGVVMAIDWVVPLIIVAQPETATLAAAIAVSILVFMIVPFPLSPESKTDFLVRY